jgi:nitrite reductase/ring-hydroxylating ferredoxin subunit
MYSLATGEGIGNDCTIAVYPARVENALIFVDVAHGQALA